jgi:hypothetical protein
MSRHTSISSLRFCKYFLLIVQVSFSKGAGPELIDAKRICVARELNNTISLLPDHSRAELGKNFGLIIA